MPIEGFLSPVTPTISSDRGSALFPPENLKDCNLLFCNGQYNFTNRDDILKRIQGCRIIGVDGGLNYCLSQLGLESKEIKWIVGDLDSISEEVKTTYGSEIESKKFKRAKNTTDLQESINLAREIENTALIIIFGGLGGRIDHTLSNLFTTLNYPMQVIFESQDQIVFGINHKSPPMMIDPRHLNRLTLVALNGTAKDIIISLEPDDANTKTDLIKSLEFKKPYTSMIYSPFELMIREGEALVILDKAKESKDNEFPPEIDWTINTPLSEIFKRLAHQSESPNLKSLDSGSEAIYNIKKETGILELPCKEGQTISLIPIGGDVQGIDIKGLKWTCENLNRSFVSISNLAPQDGTFSVSIQKGQLLVIVTSFIDRAMVNEPI